MMGFGDVLWLVLFFLAGLGVFQKQHHSVGLAVFIMAA